MKEKILKEIQNLIKTKFNKVVNIDTKFDDTGIDSIDLLDLIVEAEEKHNVKIEDSELLEIKTVNDVVEAIFNKL